MVPSHADPAHNSTEWLRRGQRALRAGRKAEARRAFQAALAADPMNAGAWLRLARLSAPRARLAYTARALELGAPQAQAELRRARRLALADRAAAALTAPPRPAQALPWMALALALLAALAIGLYAARAQPAGWGQGLAARLQVAASGGSSAGAAGAGSARLRQVATATATASPTPSPTQTAAPTATPSPTASPLPSETPTAVPPSPTAALGGERWIEVDLSEQRVVAREGETAVNTFVASTGTWQTPTLVGEFRVYVKYAAADMAGPGYYLPAVPYVMYFYQGYGLHGTYWHSNFGTPMSRGCVNLRTEDARWLFEWASVGTRVVVHD